MDRSIRNQTELEKALQSLRVKNEQGEDTATGASNVTKQTYNGSNSVSSRLSTEKSSTNSLLVNLNGLQTNCNAKIDRLSDVHDLSLKLLSNIYEEQKKQTELLEKLVRNTVNFTTLRPENYSSQLIQKSGESSIKEYGYSTVRHVYAEFLIKLLDQVHTVVCRRNSQYISTRDFNLAIALEVIKLAMENNFVKNKNVGASKVYIEDSAYGEPITNNSTKSSAIVGVASIIGSKDSTNPVTTPDMFREIFENPNYKVFTSTFRTIMQRLRIIRVLLPFYEADIISAIDYPYFNNDNNLKCDWSKISPRSESKKETKVMNAKKKQRALVAQMLAKGVPVDAAIEAMPSMGE